ncbi:ANK1 [Symbiodinium sp. CCMP2456]|nr:ANK1 [Symbiodinium sp. CCMP2456]
MYTIDLAAVLQMVKIKPHEELLADGALTLFDENTGRAAFVSHQWVAKHHPDPDHRQFRVLQDALRNILSGVTQISVDVITELIIGKSPKMTHSLHPADLYIWYDYFSCPQKENGRDASKRYDSDLAKAISSIPAYIAKCQLMFVLCPVIESREGRTVLGPSSWANRGWCRLERLAKECSGDGSFFMVKSARHVELVVTSFASSCESSPGEGCFTVEEDRSNIAPVVKQVLKQKVSQCLQNGDLPSYRVVLNAQAILCRGLPMETIADVVPGFDSSQHESDDAGSLLVAKFLFQNGFSQVCEYDAMGWSPICYAALNGHAALVKALLERRANPNDETKKGQPLLALQKMVPVLGISAFFKKNNAMTVLLEARADVSPRGSRPPPLCLASFGNNATGIQLLCQARANPNRKNLLGMSALQHACATGACDAIDMLLNIGEGNLDLSGSLHAAALLHGGSHTTISRLLEARADVDEQFRPRPWGTLQLFFTMKGLEFRLKRPTRLRTLGYHHRGATPLMVALLVGHFEAAATLVACGARAHVENSRKITAADLISEVSTPEFLKDASAGDLEDTVSVLSQLRLRRERSSFNRRVSSLLLNGTRRRGRN